MFSDLCEKHSIIKIFLKLNYLEFKFNLLNSWTVNPDLEIDVKFMALRLWDNTLN